MRITILFAIYDNDIMQTFVYGRGCHVAGIYVGVLMHAYDLLLISSIIIVYYATKAANIIHTQLQNQSINQ